MPSRNSGSALVATLLLGMLGATASFAQATWSTQLPMSAPRSRHTATLLLDGRVLIAGSIPEIYDPAADSWVLAGPTTSRSSHTATRLGDGRVLVVGGLAADTPLSTCELFDPGTGAWSSTGSLTTARAEHTASLLPDGRVLVVGGCTAFSGRACQPAAARVGTTEIYDPGQRYMELSRQPE